MKPKLISILIANIFLASPLAFAADGGLTWSGEASLGLRGVDEKARDASKLNEYRDLDSGPIGILDVRGRGDRYYVDAFGENFGRDDQYLDLRGGQYGVFKYRLYDNELRHNFGSGAGAISPYSGIGTPVLTATFPNTNTSTWNAFDNSYKRRDIGGMFEFSGNSPFYIRADANQVTFKGVRVISSTQSSFNGIVDLPSPVDYKTQNFTLEGGYQTHQGHVTVSWLHSKFSNDNELLRWTNGFFNLFDTTPLPPSNELNRFAVNGHLARLPLSSTLSGRVTYSKLTDEVPVLQTFLANGVFAATNPNSPVFNGEVLYKTASLSWTALPARQVDTRVYWYYSRKDNNSTQMEFTPAVGSGLLLGTTNAQANCANVAGANVCKPELFNYRKNNLGVEAGYRINRQNKVSAGFDYLDAERERIDFTENKDRKYTAEWKNSSLDSLTGRIKYQYLERRSTFHRSDPSNPIDAFVRRYDLANVDQNLVKLVVDVSPPVRFLDLGFEAIYKKNDYKDTILGRTEDERQEYYASVSYGDPKAFRVLLFGDIEFLKIDSRHRVGTGDPDPSAPPSGAPFSTTYNWAAKNKDKSWQVGLGADWLPMERLKLAGSLIYARTEGTVDFAALPSGGINPVVSPITLLPIGNFDNTRRTALNLKGTYRYDRHWDFTGGYAYERYRFSDIGYDGFTYVVPNAVVPNPAANSYLSGQSAFQNYTANIFYVLATYKF
ncbi:MAG: hypothetical protein A3F74_23515 [Betaproteobacteria bacterium RIFCSPLOWO2_12_FULL_62_58]|nr:MAG: hypothetical protein A3F74_23515 [Betaproteobacteria bacterium RIFCSPLOWO2_12_FULL_62_58]